MDLRFLKKKNGETVLQKYIGVGQNEFGHTVFGWADVETVIELDISRAMKAASVVLRGGPMRDYECRDPCMVECASSECQSLGRCTLSPS